MDLCRVFPKVGASDQVYDRMKSWMVSNHVPRALHSSLIIAIQQLFIRISLCDRSRIPPAICSFKSPY